MANKESIDMALKFFALPLRTADVMSASAFIGSAADKRREGRKDYPSDVLSSIASLGKFTLASVDFAETTGIPVAQNFAKTLGAMGASLAPTLAKLPGMAGLALNVATLATDLLHASEELERDGVISSATEWGIAADVAGIVASGAALGAVALGSAPLAAVALVTLLASSGLTVLSATNAEVPALGWVQDAMGTSAAAILQAVPHLAFKLGYWSASGADSLSLVDVRNAQLRAALSTSQGAAPPPLRYDPLTLDLNQDGLFTAPMTQGAYFDMATDGFAEKSGWVQAGDALVVRDLNGNGTIDNGGELFGDQTLLADGTKASNGFAALAALESNSDGTFNAQDAAWGDVKLWKDDGDGNTQEGELISFEEAGVQAIRLGYANVGTPDASGNTLAQLNAAGAVMADGTTVAAASFLLASDPMDTLPTEYLAVSETILSLPELIGAGKAYDLSQAMARDTTLEAMVSAAATSTDYDGLQAQFDAIFLRWTGASAVGVQSRGSFINAQHLAAVEAFYGQPFQGVGGTNPNANAAPILESAYQDLKSQLFTQFVAQAQLKDYWDAATVTWDDATDSNKFDYSGTAAKFSQDLAAQPATTVGLLALFAMNAKAFGVSASPEFAAFKAAFMGSDAYDKAIEAGLNGTPLMVGTDLADSKTLTSAGLLYGLAGNDTLSGSAGADMLVGGEGNDVLKGGAGDDVLGGALGSADSATAYNNPVGRYVYSFVGNDYEGGTGNDTLNGTAGADTYHFNLGDGADTLIEAGLSGNIWDWTARDWGDDVLVFGSGIAAADIRLSKVGNNLVLSHVNGQDSVTVKDWFAAQNTGFQLSRVQFADGTAWTGDYLSAHVEPIQGTAAADTLTAPVAYWARSLFGNAGDDTLTGNTGADWLTGGTGNDTLFGGAGNDIYNWTAGDGHDTLTDAAGADTIDFSAIDAAMAQFFKSGNDLEINIGDSASGMLVRNQLLTTGSAIEQFKFADATLSATEVQSMAILRV